MAQIVTIKELEEKYGWGFVVFKDPATPDGYAYVTKGEYVFHSQNKTQCWNKLNEILGDDIGVFAFGVNPKYENVYPSLSILSVVNEPPIEPVK